MCLCEVICVGDEGAFGFRFGLLELAALVIDCGKRAELGNSGIDAEFLSR